MDRWTDGQMDGWMDRRMEGREGGMRLLDQSTYGCFWVSLAELSIPRHEMLQVLEG